MSEAESVVVSQVYTLANSYHWRCVEEGIGTLAAHTVSVPIDLKKKEACVSEFSHQPIIEYVHLERKGQHASGPCVLLTPRCSTETVIVLGH